MTSGAGTGAQDCVVSAWLQCRWLSLLLGRRHQHGVDDVDHAIAGDDVGAGDGRAFHGDEVASLGEFEVRAIQAGGLGVLDVSGQGFAVSLMDTGLATHGVIICNQPRTVALRERNGKKIETASVDLVDEVLARIAPLVT